MKVLVVDDEVSLADALGELFRRNKIIADVVYDGEDGYYYAQKGDYDVIVLDVMMPHMDGNAAASAIRALDRPDARTVPIIAMSANSFGDDIKESLRAGMNAHVPKPIDERTLIGTVRRLTGQDT